MDPKWCSNMTEVDVFEAPKPRSSLHLPCRAQNLVLDDCQPKLDTECFVFVFFSLRAPFLITSDPKNLDLSFLLELLQLARDCRRLLQENKRKHVFITLKTRGRTSSKCCAWVKLELSKLSLGQAFHCADFKLWDNRSKILVIEPALRKLKNEFELCEAGLCIEPLSTSLGLLHIYLKQSLFFLIWSPTYGLRKKISIVVFCSGLLIESRLAISQVWLTGRHSHSLTLSLSHTLTLSLTFTELEANEVTVVVFLTRGSCSLIFCCQAQAFQM